ncbi:Wzz/FepE/Etk N-terminal domain-containing protein [Thalassotalea sp. 1_MG-2023]|uniref:Wzz/FepE/Etk N-terminal domain-containing protein n=1 Tax=Thalassotalea sp. 1_MG-2023 TaxID=3062680 RepID=UPI0026E35A47|nr:Wzz/FepE/Etk N-terminal domain-containing protein [Thalassotalea sp. 1_MG-2023]MDO6426510.1 Wzz/FepE/Etk N-terminal domain-containing protein [Thalassotalea sp. 1_MG-2023]
MATQNNKQDITFAELFSGIYHGKFIIILGTLASAILAVVVSLSLPNQYRSSATLIVNVDSNSKLASLAGGLGGLANIAGINIGNSSDNSNPIVARELISSQGFILNFVDKHLMLVPMMASKGWKVDSNELINDEDIYDSSLNEWKIDENSNPLLRPRKEDVVKRFKEIVRLSEDSKTGVLTLSVEFYSPYLAQEWLELLIAEVNNTIREYDIGQTSKNIEYLSSLIEETNNSNLHQVFYSLIEEQTKKLMLSKARIDYVFRTIDPPSVPEKKSKPARAVICVLVTIAGSIIFTIIALVRYFANYNK